MSFLDEKEGKVWVAGKKHVFSPPKKSKGGWKKKGENPEMAHFVRFPTLKIGGQSREKGNFLFFGTEGREIAKKKLLRGVERLVFAGPRRKDHVLPSISRK